MYKSLSKNQYIERGTTMKESLKKKIGQMFMFGFPASGFTQEYIDFCNKRQIPYTGQFFTFLLSNGYFVVDPGIIIPLDEAIHYDSLFDDDGNLLVYEKGKLINVMLDGCEKNVHE